MNKTSTELKKMNLSQVFREIYASGSASKNTLTMSLGLSIPTVTNALRELQGRNLIVREGSFLSTGGRPAFVHRFNENAKLGIGVEVLPDRVNAAAVNLYGKTVDSMSAELCFAADEDYYRRFGALVNSFAGNCSAKYGEVLGVGISLPAIINSESGEIVYSELLRTAEFNVRELTQFIGYSCECRHDAECGASAELRDRKLSADTLIIFLNNHICTAFVIGGKVHVSGNLSSGTIEHLVIHENGRECYCSKRGCVDAYCSAASLLKMSAMSTLEEFFAAVRSGDPKAAGVWDRYLDDLALAIDSARMVIPCDIIIDGYLLKFIQDQDIINLKSKVIGMTTFKQVGFSITRGECDANPVLTGAALPLLDRFLESI